MQIEARLAASATTRAALSGLGRKVDRAEARWTEEELREAVALVLADALREAGRTDRAALIRAIAPNIISTVRNEISIAHPEIIEALSPRIGELIRASVAKAVEDLQRQIDDAMPVDLWIAALRAALTGTPAAGWIIGDKSGFRVIEAFLIERGSGLVLAQDRPQGLDDDTVPALDDDLLGGMIAALDSFARDAFGTGGIDELRQLTLSAGTIYLRASPDKILALRCTGVAPPGIEEEIDALLDGIIRRLREGGDGSPPARLLAAGVGPPKAVVRAGPLLGRVALGAVAALLAVWLHGVLEEANGERWAGAARAAARADPAMTGYPVAARHAGGTVTLTGLVPDEAARAAILARLDALPLPVPVSLAMPVAGRRLVP